MKDNYMAERTFLDGWGAHYGVRRRWWGLELNWLYRKRVEASISKQLSAFLQAKVTATFRYDT